MPRHVTDAPVQRRSRSNEEDAAADFDPDAFRRQSTMLHDDGASGMTRATSYNRGGARPPTMIEQKLANAPASYAQPPVPSHPYGYGGYGYGGFQPGQVVAAYTPTTVNSANPFFNGYADSPAGTPVSGAHYDAGYDAHGNMLSRRPSSGSAPVLSRTASLASKPVPEPPADPHYVDVSRASVTPYQAAQYVEISRQLNAPPPPALPLAAVHEDTERAPEYAEHLPASPAKGVAPLDLKPQVLFDAPQHLGAPHAQPTPRESAFPESPFADPHMGAQQPARAPRRPSEEDLPTPPPAFAAAGEHGRVASIPPMLPEIQLQRGSFSPASADFPVAPSSVRPSPSSFSTAFDIPTPPPGAHFPESPAPAPSAHAPAPVRGGAVQKRPDTVYTMYDDEDAYGGM